MGVVSAVAPAGSRVAIVGETGAGKTTLIDELVLRFLKRDPKIRLAILSHDPSVVGEGALLGDRATMINSQDDRVFMRSMATRGQAGGLSPATESCLALLAHSGFDYVIIETVGTGQEALPFRNKLVDQTVLVMNPDYGARLQLQKIVMLDVADIVVVNKTDLERAKAATGWLGAAPIQDSRGCGLKPCECATGSPALRTARSKTFHPLEHLRDPQPPPELRHHGQRPQPLFQHPDHRDLRPRPLTPPPRPYHPTHTRHQPATRQHIPQRALKAQTTQQPVHHSSTASNPMCEDRG